MWIFLKFRGINYGIQQGLKFPFIVFSTIKSIYLLSKKRLFMKHMRPESDTNLRTK